MVMQILFKFQDEPMFDENTLIKRKRKRKWKRIICSDDDDDNDDETGCSSKILHVDV